MGAHSVLMLVNDTALHRAGLREFIAPFIEPR